jgi:hypothetical protein
VASTRHRRLCLDAARWLLERGCAVVAYEADVWAWVQNDRARSTARLAGLARTLAELVDDFTGRDRADLIAARKTLSGVLRRSPATPAVHHVFDAVGIRRHGDRYDVLVVEAKVTLEDLRADGKMAGYADCADYAYLLVADGLQVPDGFLPGGWGLLAAAGDGRVRSARAAHRLAGPDEEIRAQVVQGLLSHRHRNVLRR